MSAPVFRFKNPNINALLQASLLYVETVEDSSRRERYHEMFVAYGMLGIAMEWITGGFQEEPEKLAALFTNRIDQEYGNAMQCNEFFRRGYHTVAVII